MLPEVETWLHDILLAIQEIDEFIPSERIFGEFEKDIKTKKAVERNIEIVGEAINRILKVQPEINISDTRKIVDTRNRIIHGYDNVSADVLWLIINRYLPALETEVKELLK